MTLLIDADYLIYSSCCAVEFDRRWTCGNHTLDSHEDDVMTVSYTHLTLPTIYSV